MHDAHLEFFECRVDQRSRAKLQNDVQIFSNLLFMCSYYFFQSSTSLVRFFSGFIKSVPPDLGGGLQKLAAEADPTSIAVRVFSGKKMCFFFPRSPYRGPYTISYFQKEEGSNAILVYFCSKDSSGLRF